VNPPDAVIICRCENVSAGQILEAVLCGSLGPNQTKAFVRTGMGPCQGGCAARAWPRSLPGKGKCIQKGSDITASVHL
jgi:BFD-like [2Fe-2S] binding domain